MRTPRVKSQSDVMECKLKLVAGQVNAITEYRNLKTDFPEGENNPGLLW